MILDYCGSEFPSDILRNATAGNTVLNPEVSDMLIRI